MMERSEQKANLSKESIAILGARAMGMGTRSKVKEILIGYARERSCR